MKLPLKAGRAVVTLALLGTALGLGAGAAGAAPSAAAATSVNCPAPTIVGASFNDVLPPNFAIRSPSARYLFIMQTDGNLVLYDCTGHRVCWASGTEHNSGVVADFRANDPSGFFGITLETPNGHLSPVYQGSNADGVNVSVNNNGEVWIGNTENFHC